MNITRSWSYKDLSGPSTARFSQCEKYRYELTRIWDTSKPRLIFVGLNPSTADAFEDDPTIRREIGFAERWGFGQILKLNIFAFRSTDPRGLLTTPDPVGPENDQVLRSAFRAKDRLVLCWGVGGELFARGALVAGWALAEHGKPEAFGLTKNGYPKHPLYLSDEATTSSYRALITGGLEE